MYILITAAVAEAAQEISPAVIQWANVIAGLGIGGIAVKLIDVYASRGITDAEEENLSVNTQSLLSQLIETSTETLRQSVKDQETTIEKQRVRIETLESMLESLKEELDESVLIQRLRDAEHDNIYLRGRVKTLLGRTEALREENERLISELNQT